MWSIIQFSLLPAFPFLVFAGISFVSVFHPQWDLRWAGRSMRGDKGVPLSTRSRIFFTGFFAYIATVIFLCPFTGSKIIWEIMIASVALFLIIGYKLFFMRDKKDFS
jgi:hypothetical protein